MQQCMHSQDCGVAALIACNAQLESVRLNGALGNMSLVSIAECCGQQLCHLSVGGFFCRDDSGFDALATKCHSIVSLRCRAARVSTGALTRLVLAQTALRELSFARARINDTVLYAALQHASSLNTSTSTALPGTGRRLYCCW
jgi:hypothetical protein